MKKTPPNWGEGECFYQKVLPPQRTRYKKRPYTGVDWEGYEANLIPYQIRDVVAEGKARVLLVDVVKDYGWDADNRMCYIHHWELDLHIRRGKKITLTVGSGRSQKRVCLQFNEKHELFQDDALAALITTIAVDEKFARHVSKFDPLFIYRWILWKKEVA